MKKHILGINNRGYLFVGKIDGCPDMNKVKSYDLNWKEENRHLTVHLHEDDAGKEKAKKMVNNGYLQLGDYFKKETCEILAIQFKTDGKTISMAPATREEIAHEANVAIEKKTKTKSEKSSEITDDYETERKRLVDAGLAQPAEKTRTNRLVWTKPKLTTVDTGIKVKCLNAKGIWAVKSVKDGGVIECVNNENTTRMFHINELETA